MFIENERSYLLKDAKDFLTTEEIIFFSRMWTKKAWTLFLGKKIMIGNKNWPLKNKIKIDVKIDINKKVV